jgi:hypothetical protein
MAGFGTTAHCSGKAHLRGLAFLPGVFLPALGVAILAVFVEYLDKSNAGPLRVVKLQNSKFKLNQNAFGRYASSICVGDLILLGAWSLEFEI